MSIRDESWKPFVGDRRLVEKDGYDVVYSEFPAVPLCCPVCETVLRSKADEDEHKRNGCCHLCAVRWAYPNLPKWKDGWRPTREEIASQPRAVIEFVFKL
jgi:hypothetical protein